LGNLFDDFDDGFGDLGGFDSGDSNSDDLFGADQSSDMFGSDTGDASSGLFGDSDDSDESEESDFDEDGASQSNTNDVKKIAIKAIICGILLIVIVFGVMNLITRFTGDKSENTPSSNASTVEPNNTGNNNQNNIMSKPDRSDWVQFNSGNEITFKDDYISSTFTVTSYSHYLKVVDSNSNLQVKTILVGALAGYQGTYELEVPYNIGKNVEVGMSFDVSLRIGETKDGNSVVGEIVYE